MHAVEENGMHGTSGIPPPNLKGASTPSPLALLRLLRRVFRTKAAETGTTLCQGPHLQSTASTREDLKP